MIKRHCLDNCGQLTTDTRCRDCRNKRKRATYGHKDYLALGRPSGPCRMGVSRNCSGRAESWQHIDGNPFNHHPSNMIGACSSCNSSDGARGS